MNSCSSAQSLMMAEGKQFLGQSRTEHEEVKFGVINKYSEIHGHGMPTVHWGLHVLFNLVKELWGRSGRVKLLSTYIYTHIF